MRLSHAAFACLLALAAVGAQAAQGPVAQVETVALARRPMTQTVAGYGTVAPDPRAVETLSLARPGRVVSLVAAVGEKVRKGALLLEFGTGADASLAYRQASDAVRFASGELQRLENLARQQLATRSQVAAARKALADARAALATQEAKGAGQALERVTAPADGVVLAILAEQGQRLAAGAPVLRFARAGRAQVLLGIEPSEAAALRPGMEAEVVPVLDAASPITARVTRVGGMIDPQTQFVDVTLSLDAGAPIPGTRVRASVRLRTTKPWVVPRSAVLTDEHGAYLFQVRAGRAVRVDVRTGIEQDGMVAVEGKLEPAEPVVRLGNYELTDGMAVREAAR